MKLTEVNILGKVYKIIYFNNVSEVDVDRQGLFWGQMDPWTRTIRIYAKNRTAEDMWETILHETLHAIADILDLSIKDKEKTIDLLSTALADMMIRNNWINSDILSALKKGFLDK